MTLSVDRFHDYIPAYPNWCRDRELRTYPTQCSDCINRVGAWCLSLARVDERWIMGSYGQYYETPYLISHRIGITIYFRVSNSKTGGYALRLYSL